MDKALSGLCGLLRRLYIQWDLAGRQGLLQRRDPRVKLLLLLGTVIVVSVKQTLLAQALVGGLLLGAALFSRIPLREVQGKALIMAAVFGLLLPAPSALNLVAPGEVILPLLQLGGAKRLLWFQVPETVGFTREGALGVAILAGRIMNSLSVVFLVLNSTPVADMVRALKHFRVPDTLVWVVLLTYRYLFVLVNLVEQMHRARAARLIKGASSGETRIWAAHRMAFLFQRTQLRCEEMFRAMQSRGFSGKVRVEALGAMAPGDWACIGLMAGLMGLIVFF